MELSWGWALIWVMCALYTYRGTMTGPLRADASGEREQPFGRASLLATLKLAWPMAVALGIAAWPEVDHAATVPSAPPDHEMIGVAASALGFGSAMVVLRWKKWWSLS
ncbi:hypothetical protein [Deinococcus altitudinis]|uniref:hypothetical protein n=1 Tax=Deinococcus altitudinis TaxID=468914 RepID=UPI003891BA71